MDTILFRVGLDHFGYKRTKENELICFLWFAWLHGWLHNHSRKCDSLEVVMMASAQDNDFTFHAVCVPTVFRRIGFFRAKPPSYRIGPGGLVVTADRAFSVGVKLDVEMFLSATTSVTCLTRVAWSTPVPQTSGGGFHLGLHILQIEGLDETLVWKATEGGASRNGVVRKPRSSEMEIAVPNWGAATAFLFPES